MTDLMINSFLAVCRTSSITKAALIGNLTQQAVSKHITNLESELGVQLFFRDRRAMTMTPAGHKYFDFFASMSKQFHSIQHEVADLQIRFHSQTLRIAYLDRLLIPAPFQQAIQELKKEFPPFRVEYHALDESEVAEALCNGLCDLYFGYNIFHHINSTTDILQFKIANDNIVYAVSELNPSGRSAVSLSDLSGEPFYFPSHQRYRTFTAEESIDDLYHTCVTDGFDPGEIYLCKCYSDVKLNVLAGDGVCLTSSFDSLVADPRIKTYPSGIHSELYCIYISGNISPFVEPLMRCLRAASWTRA